MLSLSPCNPFHWNCAVSAIISTSGMLHGEYVSFDSLFVGLSVAMGTKLAVLLDPELVFRAPGTL